MLKEYARNTAMKGITVNAPTLGATFLFKDKLKSPSGKDIKAIID